MSLASADADAVPLLVGKGRALLAVEPAQPAAAFDYLAKALELRRAAEPAPAPEAVAPLASWLVGAYVEARAASPAPRAAELRERLVALLDGLDPELLRRADGGGS